jgi:hypothetical protein
MATDRANLLLDGQVPTLSARRLSLPISAKQASRKRFRKVHGHDGIYETIERLRKGNRAGMLYEIEIPTVANQRMQSAGATNGTANATSDS